MKVSETVEVKLDTTGFHKEADCVKERLAELRELGLEAMQILRVQPDDVIVLRMPEGAHLSEQQIADLNVRAKRLFSGHEVVVLEGSVSLEVVRSEVAG